MIGQMADNSEKYNFKIFPFVAIVVMILGFIGRYAMPWSGELIWGPDYPISHPLGDKILTVVFMFSILGLTGVITLACKNWLK